MRPEPDYYAILQVNPRAEPEVIQAAYRRLAAKYHPDVNPSPQAAERMKQLNAAYEVLSLPEKRAAYNQTRISRRRRGIAVTRIVPKRQAWWLLPLALAILLLALRTKAKFVLLVGLLFLVLWLIRRRQAAQEGKE